MDHRRRRHGLHHQRLSVPSIIQAEDDPSNKELHSKCLITIPFNKVIDGLVIKGRSFGKANELMLEWFDKVIKMVTIAKEECLSNLLE